MALAGADTLKPVRGRPERIRRRSKRDRLRREKAASHTITYKSIQRVCLDVTLAEDIRSIDGCETILVVRVRFPTCLILKCGDPD